MEILSRNEEGQVSVSAGVGDQPAVLGEGGEPDVHGGGGGRGFCGIVKKYLRGLNGNFTSNITLNLHSGTTISYETANEGQTCNTNGEKKNNKAKLQRSHLHSWTTTTRTPFNDGHQWRKYGEKKISNCKMPRCYYRCTHKDDQGCQATKQVQQKDNEDPPIYMVTYNKQHSCKTNFIYSEEFEQFELIVEPPITDPCQLSL
ncbi:uncharacterized protein A4U43_C07F5640 [Asparagus officinalis]|uniref:WRKY domain-containing protein n=1 Tax=Asparagus officinalis TaxID=4686 RepID=A0A5P1E9N7_ASPOF|nr:uncharacterized protein A4U43_C07F5640 [Asparagus officinalis]